MPGRVHDIFALSTLLAKLEGLQQLATDVFEAREDPIQLTSALPHILQQIFCGTDGSTKLTFLDLFGGMGWCEDSPWIEAEAYVDKEALTGLLSPSGSLLKHLILSRFDQDIRYEFPIDLLPHPFQEMIKAKNISSLPPLLKSKFADKSVSGRYLLLNTWEFYLFYFASYGVHYVPGRAPPKGATNLPTKSAHLNSISGWFQMSTGALSGSEVDEVDDEYLDSSHAYSYLLEMYMRFYVFKSFEDDLKSSKSALTFLNNDYYTSVSSEYAILSSSLLEVVLECFLNIFDDSNSSEYIVPSDLIIEALTICIKALMRGMRSIRTLEYGPPAIAHSVRGKSGFFKTTQEDLFKQLFATTVRNRFYLFMTRAFGYAYWSHDTLRLLRYVVEIWGMIIRPWSLGEPSWMIPSEPSQSRTGKLKAFFLDQSNSLKKQITQVWSANTPGHKSDENADSRTPAFVDQARRDYVLDNFILYTPTLVAFLQMSQRFSLALKKELKIVTTALVPWVNSDIMAMVKEVDSCVFKTQESRRDSVAVAHNIERVAEAAKAALKFGDVSLPFVSLNSQLLLDLSRKLYARMKMHMQHDQPEKVLVELENSIEDLQTVFDIGNMPDPVAFDTNDSGSGVGNSFADRLPKTKFMNSRATGPQRVRDIKFLGDPKLRPIASNENRFFVRRAYSLAQLIKKKTGVELELRLLGSYKLFLWISFLSILVLLFMGFIALIQSDLASGDYESYDYNYGYDSSGYSYDYSHQQARNGGYR